MYIYTIWRMFCNFVRFNNCPRPRQSSWPVKMLRTDYIWIWGLWNEGWALNCGLFCGFLIGPWSQPPYWDIRLSSYFCSLSLCCNIILNVYFWWWIDWHRRLKYRKLWHCMLFGTPAFWAFEGIRGPYRVRVAHEKF